MAPTLDFLSDILDARPSDLTFKRDVPIPTGDWRQVADQYPEDLVIESWSEGFMVGALIVMACITIANMRRRVLLHKLVLLELLLAMSHGTFCFMQFKGYGWYLSTTAMLLYISWVIHNVVAWMKVRPFFIQPGGFFGAKFGIWTQRIYLGTLSLSIPVIAFEISNNFRYFNDRGGWYTKVRPYEPLMRDPWWVFTCLALINVVRGVYGAGIIGLLKNSPRFGILLGAIFLSITFTILDIVVSIHQFVGKTDGINPFWKLSLVFKCLTDTIMLDDFKTELKRLNVKRIRVEEARRNSTALVADLNGYDNSAFSQPRRNARHRLDSPTSPLQSRIAISGDSDSTIIQDPQDFRNDKDEDPLSDYTANRKSQANSRARVQLTKSKAQQGRRDTNANDAGLEEVEFATALELDPRHFSGCESVQQERHRFGSTAKKIGRLPGLNHFKFEAIKPGRKSGARNGGNEDTSDPENEKRDSESSKNHSETIADDDGNMRLRNIHEEIMRNTILDLEAQREVSEARKQSNTPNGSKGGARKGRSLASSKLEAEIESDSDIDDVTEDKVESEEADRNTSKEDHRPQEQSRQESPERTTGESRVEEESGRKHFEKDKPQEQLDINGPQYESSELKQDQVSHEQVIKDVAASETDSDEIDDPAQHLDPAGTITNASTNSPEFTNTNVLTSTNSSTNSNRSHRNNRRRSYLPTSRLEATIEDERHSDDDEVDADQRTRWLRGSLGMGDLDIGEVEEIGEELRKTKTEESGPKDGQR